MYICTEDPFPIRRLKQLQAEQACLRTDVPPDVVSSIPFSDNIYVEHAADLVGGHTGTEGRCKHHILTKVAIKGYS